MPINNSLISAGSDAVIKLWDLEQAANPSLPFTHRPVATTRRTDDPAHGHRYGVTHLSFYPFDSAAFLSTSYDQTLKLWSAATAQVSGSFALGAKAYTHAVSPIASHLLVACATQHPAVRLVDLRSSAAVQSLVAPGILGGAAGANLAVAWSPTHEHVLASGSLDGAVRIWDVRRSSALVGLLDFEDSLGPLHPSRLHNVTGPSGADGLAGRGIRSTARAHNAPVNGITWTDDGAYVVTAGLDRKIRVWDAATGANTLAAFGPAVRNDTLARITMFVSPTGLMPKGRDLLFFPSEREVLVMDLHEGTTATRLRAMEPSVSSVRAAQGGERTVRNRVTSSMYSHQLYSGHGVLLTLRLRYSCMEGRRRRGQL